MKKWVMFIGVFLIVFVVVASQSKEIGAFYMNNFHNFNESSMNINFNDEDKKFERIIDIGALNYQIFYLDNLETSILISVEDVDRDLNYSLIIEDSQGNQVAFQECIGPSTFTFSHELEDNYKLVLLNGTQNISGKLISTIQ